MALFTSIIFGQISGSIDGLTFSRNAGGQYVKSKSLPVNPNSERQQEVRSVWASMSQDWNGILTNAQRIAWNTYALNVTIKNRLGHDIHIKGINHFMRSNAVALAAGGALIADAPTTFNLGETDPTLSAAISEATQAMTVSFDDTLEWLDQTNAFLQVSMSLPQNESVFFLPPTARVAGYVDGDDTTPPTTPAVIVVPFPVAETQKVIVKARILLADGRLSEPFQHTVNIGS